MSKEMSEKESKLNTVSEEEMKKMEPHQINEDELVNVSGGMTNEYGCTITTIGYGCENWKASQATWTATAGHCGSRDWNRLVMIQGIEDMYTICTYNCDFVNGTYSRKCNC
jgi:hypothetical protein